MKYQIMTDIFFTLLSRKIVSAQELAARHEVSARSIYRYVDELCIAGIPIQIRSGRGGGIYIPDSFKLPVNFMKEEEYRAAIAAMKAMRGQIENKALDSAIEKLTRQVKEELSDSAVTGDVVVDSSSWGDYRFTEKIKLLQKAIHSCELLEIEYVSRTGARTMREIEAHVLVYKQNIWYVYAYCRKRDDFRLFKIGRIRALTGTGETFTRRAFTREDIPLQFVREKTEQIAVNLEISPDALPDAEEWLGVDCILRAPNGKFTAEVTLPDDDGLINKLLSLGRGVKVVSPEKIKIALKEAAKKIIDCYE